jgi:hypothetical protein
MPLACPVDYYARSYFATTLPHPSRASRAAAKPPPAGERREGLGEFACSTERNDPPGMLVAFGEARHRRKGGLCSAGSSSDEREAPPGKPVTSKDGRLFLTISLPAPTGCIATLAGIQSGLSRTVRYWPPKRPPAGCSPSAKPKQNRQEPWGQGHPVKLVELLTSGQLRIAGFCDQPYRRFGLRAQHSASNDGI